MPILPRRRRMGPTTPPPFRRRTPPTPQATRLMKISLGAGILFVVVLGIVFVPRALQYGENERPSIVLQSSGSDPFVVTVSAASRAHPLAAYRAELNVTNGTARDDIAIGPLDRPGPWGSVSANFEDRDGNAVLSVGDRFTFRAKPAAQGPWTYTLSVFYIPADANASAPCPCAVGRVGFTA